MIWIAQAGLMKSADDLHWTGWGRWLLIGLGLFLIIFAVPFVFTGRDGAGAGWDMFLGLLAIGTVASGNRRAPLLAFSLTALMIVRFVFALARGMDLFVVAVPLILACLAAAAAYDLRRQSMSA